MRDGKILKFKLKKTVGTYQLNCNLNIFIIRGPWSSGQRLSLLLLQLKLESRSSCQTYFSITKQCFTEGESPGLVVMRGISCLRGCEFESQRLILYGEFTHSFVLRLYFCLNERKYMKKRPGIDHLKTMLY